MRDVIEVSYTGDLLSHRRCSRAWAYEKHAGFNPYEQVQALEGRLIHHAMEWMTRQYIDVLDKKRHVTRDELQAQLERYFRVLWSRGMRTAFASKRDTIERVRDRLFDEKTTQMEEIVRVAIEGAQHTEYELRSVRKLLKAKPGTKQKVLLTGVLDLVVQQKDDFIYKRVFEWIDRTNLTGEAESGRIKAKAGDREIWDYKGTKADTLLLTDYVRQLLTYAHLYKERTGVQPARCVLFFVNEPEKDRRLLAVELDEQLLERAVEWTHDQVLELQATIAQFQKDPCGVPGGEREKIKQGAAVGRRVTSELQQQCTACGMRFDCDEYKSYLDGNRGAKKRGGATHEDIDILNVMKN